MPFTRKNLAAIVAAVALSVVFAGCVPSTEPGAQGTPSDAWFIELARCEQPGDGWQGVQWDSEGTYPGGMGVLAAAWDENGGREFADNGAHATPQQQLEVARRIWLRYGPSAWSCSARIG